MKPKQMEEIEKKEAELTKTKFLKNVLIVIISNFFSAASGILIGFLVPKILNVYDYGYYKTFTLYCSYIGILHLGFIDGIYLKFAGKKYDELDKYSFRTYTLFLVLLETGFAVVLILISLFFIKSDSYPIFIFVSLNIIIANLLSYFEFVTQITMQFKRRSIRKALLAFLNIASILTLFLLYHYSVYQISGLIYIVVTLSISLIILIWYIVTFRDMIFGKRNSFKAEKQNIFGFLKIGFPLLLSNLVSQFIFAVDQQFINIFYNTETFAAYAFAYSMISVLSIATSAISVVFFPTLKGFSDENKIERYANINSYFLLFIAFCLLVYYPIDVFVTFFLDKYISSLNIFLIIIPGVVLSSCITSIKYDFYKSLNHIKIFFVVSIIILGLSIGADAIVNYLSNDPKYIAIASIVMLFIWYITIEVVFNKLHKTSWIKNFLYLSIIVFSFYGISFIQNKGLGMLAYFLAYLIVSYVFFYKIINSGLLEIKNKLFKKKTG